MTLRARDIADLCDDLALERASVTVKEGWDSPMFFLTFGPRAYRHTMEIHPSRDLNSLRANLEAANAALLAGATVPAPKPISQPVATPAPAKGKRKRRDEEDGH